MENEEKEKHEPGYYFNFREVLTYFFRKKDPSRPTNINIKMMHGINKISMLIFLICLIVIIARFIIRAM
ncbi:DUF6728 family protein [Marinoscillum sp. MHG1-6]|uniref:DUF6728 family protein n=1 Tax=Marinoscillum sp. MHG1-6 TaxID=2959627 RepID=UPI002157A6B3|nr:DUF6728 family protein [Marinoscillum sp. MHG1-6]